LRVLHARGLCDSALQTIYRAVVVAKLISSSWIGFTNATDREKMQALIHRAGFCNTELDHCVSVYAKADNDLFKKILKVKFHRVLWFQLLLSKEGVFIHVTTAQADEDVLLPGQVYIWSKVHLRCF